ncbi:NTP-binding protein [Aeromonas caviae]
MRTTADTGLSGAACTTAVKPSQLVQSSSENDNMQTVIKNERF